MTLERLNSHLDLLRRTQEYRQHIEELRSRALLRSPSFSGMPSGGSTIDTVGEVAAEVVDYDARHGYLCAALDRSRKEVAEFIATIDDPNLALIFSLRYLEGHTFKDVAETIGGGNTTNGIQMQVYRYLDSLK